MSSSEEGFIGADDRTRESASEIRPAEFLGSYHLLQRVGEGGMGEVWLAEQTAPVRRRVALKVIKAGMDTAQVVARFEAERQALALMDHPSIAHVFDAGTTPLGRPYFVMEYVQGDPIGAYCARHKLTLPERLQLFIQVCEGVQHAHQKGIIHRDLKPSNVLVMLQDGHPVPKIIDFGVAKAVTHNLIDRPLHTEIGALVGTPEYMSPEQADVSGLDVDTRTDVYALGVLLYELLTGVLPFEPAALRARGVDEIRRTIREVDPPKPSTRVAVRTADGGARTSESTRLTGQLRGDLDWITMKALEKDRTRRYETANGLAMDLRRHLAGDPVLAAPPSTLYRVTKFSLRHRVGVVAALGTLLLLLIFAVSMSLQARRIARERDRANAQAARADREAAAARQVSDFLVGLFAVSDPSEARGNQITARAILDKGAREIDQTLRDQPELQARLQTTMGSVYSNLGAYAAARPLLEQAVATSRRVLGDDASPTLKAIDALADLDWYEGRYRDAEPLYVELIERFRRVLGPEHQETLRAQYDLASLFVADQRLAEAEQLSQATLQIQTRVLGRQHRDTLSTLGNLQATYFRQGRFAEAEPVAREVLDGERRLLGEMHPSTLTSRHNLATICEKLGKGEEAEQQFLTALSGKRRVLGDLHPSTLITLSRLASMYTNQGRFAEAEAQLLPVAQAARNLPSVADGARVDIVAQLANLYVRSGKPRQAAEWQRGRK
jgi:non-specific serine/threonine protein kinase/serine/threonine-protein kinase